MEYDYAAFIELTLKVMYCDKPYFLPNNKYILNVPLHL